MLYPVPFEYAFSIMVVGNRHFLISLSDCQLPFPLELSKLIVLSPDSGHFLRHIRWLLLYIQARCSTHFLSSQSLKFSPFWFIERMLTAFFFLDFSFFLFSSGTLLSCTSVSFAIIWKLTEGNKLQQLLLFSH